jgi:electron transport complex protein RnfB
VEYRVALIDESRCVGCAKCIAACPTDAIVGAERYLHTVLEAECIGCELCLPPCPVDCIVMEPVAEKPFDDVVARQRVKARKARMHQKAQEARVARAQLKALDPLAGLLKSRDDQR